MSRSRLFSRGCGGLGIVTRAPCPARFVPFPVAPTTQSRSSPSGRPFHSSPTSAGLRPAKPTIPEFNYRVPTPAFPDRLPSEVIYCPTPVQATSELARLQGILEEAANAGDKEAPDQTIWVSASATERLGVKVAHDLAIAAVTIVTGDEVLIIRLAAMQGVVPELLKDVLENPDINKRVFGIPSVMALFAQEHATYKIVPRRLIDVFALCDIQRLSIRAELDPYASVSREFEAVTGTVLGHQVSAETAYQYNYRTIGWSKKHRVRNYVVNGAWAAHLVGDVLLQEMDKTSGWATSRAIKNYITNW